MLKAHLANRCALHLNAQCGGPSGLQCPLRDGAMNKLIAADDETLVHARRRSRRAVPRRGHQACRQRCIGGELGHTQQRNLIFGKQR